jgi:hypothetical protein
MSLVQCPDCGRKVSERASACPECGCPLGRSVPPPLPAHQGRVCPYCGGSGVGKARGLQGFAEVFLGFVLTFLFLIPGVIYYIYMESVPYCASCGRRVWS